MLRSQHKVTGLGIQEAHGQIGNTSAMAKGQKERDLFS